MSNLQQLIELEDRFQPHVKKGYYTFIAPTDPAQFEQFMKVANNNIASMSIHGVLSNRAGTRDIVKNLYLNNDLRVYVMYAGDETILIHGSIEEYCDRNKIDFQV